MNENYSRKGDMLTVKMPEELDEHVASGLCRELDFLIDSYGIRRIVFDFENTEFMDSSGIGVIIGRTRNIGFFGGKTYAIHLNRQIRKIFRASGLQRIVQVEEEKGEAHE